MYSTGLPGGGPALQYILSILDGKLSLFFKAKELLRPK